MRAVGPWLFALLDNQLYATDDFGATWLAPSAALLSQGITQTCTSFAVNPTDPANLYCTEGYGDRTASAGTATAADGVWETRDGGQTWRPLTAPGDSRSGAKGIPWNPRCQCLDVGMLIGASAGAIYAYTGAGIARHPLRGGSWQAVAALPQLTWSPGPRATAVTFGAPVDFAPDDTVYVAATQAMAPRAEVQAYTLPPGSMSFVAVGQRNPLPVTGVWSLALGGVRPGGQPAMYLYTPTLPNNGRLYRLALPGETSAPTLDGTPLPTTLPTAAASTVSCPAARGDLGAIRPGGLGADLSTFPGRWGPSDGVAGGSVYFGRYAGTNMPILEASAAPNHRVYLMSVRAYPSRRMTLAQAEALAQSILPANAVAQGGLQASGGATTRAYCSAAYAAAFPLSLGVPVAITAHWSSRTPWTAMVPSPRSPSARPLPRSGRHRS